MRKLPVRWGARERGATMVIVAVAMTALLGMAAISIDYAAASSKKQQIQAAADSAALEIAQSCGTAEATCSANAPDKADWYAGQADGEVTSVSVNTSTDIVSVSMKSDTRTILSKAAFGDEASASTTSAASAKAKYLNGTVVEYMPMYPLAFEYCKWKAAGSSEDTYTIGSIPWVSQSTPPSSCKDPRDNTTANMDGPHNRAALIADTVFGFNNKCEVMPGQKVRVWQHYTETALNFFLDIKTECRAKFETLTKGQTLLVPIYASYKQKVGSTWFPQNPSVRIVGFAPFKLAADKPFVDRDWLFFDVRKNTCSLGLSAAGGLIETGCYKIIGKFVQTTELFPDAKYGTESNGMPAPNLGAKGTIVKLIP